MPDIKYMLWKGLMYVRRTGIRRRFLAASLALIMSLGLLNGGMFSRSETESMSKGVFAAGSEGYELGQTYYDIGTMTVDAYYDGTNMAADKLQENWDASEVTSLLTEGVTLPGTTDLNTKVGDGLQSIVGTWDNGVHTADYKAGIPNGTKYYYVAKGETSYDAEAAKVVLTWSVKTWADGSQQDAVEAYLSGKSIASENAEAIWNSEAFTKAAPVWESGNVDFTKWNEQGDTTGVTLDKEGHALTWSGSDNMMMTVSDTQPVQWGSKASGEDTVVKNDENIVTSGTTTALRTAEMSKDGWMNLMVKQMGDTDANVDINDSNWAAALPNELKSAATVSETAPHTGWASTYMDGIGGAGDIIAYLNAHRDQDDHFDLDAQKWVNVTKWTLPAYNTPGLFKSMFEGGITRVLNNVKSGMSVGYMSGRNEFANKTLANSAVNGLRIYALETEAFIKPGGLWDGALNETVENPDVLHIGDTTGDFAYGRNPNAAAKALCISPSQVGNVYTDADKHDSIWLENGTTYLDLNSYVSAYHDGVPTRYMYVFDQEAYDLYQADQNNGNRGIQLWNETIRRNLVSSVIYNGYDAEGHKLNTVPGVMPDGSDLTVSAINDGEVFVNTQAPMELRSQVYFDVTDDFQRAEAIVTASRSIEAPVIDSTEATDGGRRVAVIPTTSSTIEDVVTYHGLTTGGSVTYTLTSELFQADDFTKSGETYELKAGAMALKTLTTNLNVVASVAEIPTIAETTGSVDVAKQGTVKVTFAGIDTTPYDGKALVVRETITASTGASSVHGDPGVASQVVAYEMPLVPTILTSAVSGTGSKHLDAVAGETIVDTVTLTNLEAGEYQLTGSLFDKTADVAVEGSEVVGEKFTVTKGETTQKTMTFTLTADMAAALKGHDVVVYETVKNSVGETVLNHADKTDADQTVKVNVAAVTTTLTGKDGAKTGLEVSDEISLSDAIHYTGLVAGNQYRIVSTFVNKVSGETIKTAVGDEAVVSKTVTATGDIYDVTATFTFTGMAEAFYGKSVVAFNELYRVMGDGELLLVSERDLDNADQTVSFAEKPGPVPAIDTWATGKGADNKYVQLEAEAVMNDRVDYKDLTVGAEYTLVTTVFDKTANAMISGLEIQTKFTPVASAGVQNVEFKLNTTALDSHVLVVYQTLKLGDTVVLTHADAEDTDQTVTVMHKGSEPSRPSYSGSSDPSPYLDTVAYGGGKSEKEIPASRRMVINDEVKYYYLSRGTTYTLVGTLYNKTQKKMVEGVEVTQEFKADSSRGTVTMSFTVDTTGMVGDELVVYETLKRGTNGYTVCSHKSNYDKDQTVKIGKPLETDVPLGGLDELVTVAVDAKSGTHVMTISSDAAIIDTVSFKGLTLGETYIIIGQVYDKATNKAIGTINSVTKTFTPVSAEGGILVRIPVNTTDKALSGKELVVVETIYEKDGKTLVGTHQDMADVNQTVKVPDASTVATVATDKVTGGKALSLTNTVIKDTVNYWFLTPGTEYKVTAIVMDKATGLAVEGIRPVTVQFKAEAANGSVTVEIPVENAYQYRGKELVVFETVTALNGTVVAEHVDLNDAAQTVHVANIATTLTPSDTTSKVVDLGEAETLLDSIGYYGLEVGTDYKVNGYVLDVTAGGKTAITLADGRVIELAGKLVAENVKAFKAETEYGYYTVDFQVDTRELSGHKLVAVEFISCDGKVIAQHADLNDAKQTVTVRVKTVVQTGNDMEDVLGNMSVVLSVLLVLLFCGYMAYAVFYVSKRENDMSV